jgi:hypothetical protein
MNLLIAYADEFTELLLAFGLRRRQRYLTMKT